MPVTEESRHRLHQTLDRTIGEEEATTLMEHLPPVGWADVATKTDLATLQTAIDHRFDTERTRTDARFDIVDARLASGFEAVDIRLDQISKDISALGTRIDDGDRRSEALTARVDQLIWQVIAVLGTIGVLMIGWAQIFG